MVVAEQRRDYSQAGEQEAILSWAAAQGRAGSFVDLGAFDGERYSNTAALADEGWWGICVEAAPDAAAACAQRYSGNADVRVVLGAFATGREPVVTFHWTPDEMYSSLRSDQAGRVSRPIVIDVPRVDLGWFAGRLADLRRPLFCSIDLEGTSLDALEWMLTNAPLSCVCIEANVERDRAQVRALLRGWEELEQPNKSNLLLARPG